MEEMEIIENGGPNSSMNHQSNTKHLREYA
jgi:hypothetical protein